MIFDEFWHQNQWFWWNPVMREILCRKFVQHLTGQDFNIFISILFCSHGMVLLYVTTFCFSRVSISVCQKFRFCTWYVEDPEYTLSKQSIKQFLWRKFVQHLTGQDFNIFIAPQALLENLFEVRDEGALRLHAREWARLFVYFWRLFEHLAHRFSWKQGFRWWGRSQLNLCTDDVCHTLRATFFPALFGHFWDTTRAAWAIGVLEKGRPRAELGLGKALKWDPSLWSRSGFGRALRTGSQAAPAAPPAPRVHSS